MTTRPRVIPPTLMSRSTCPGSPAVASAGPTTPATTASAARTHRGTDNATLGTAAGLVGHHSPGVKRPCSSARPGQRRRGTPARAARRGRRWPAEPRARSLFRARLLGRGATTVRSVARLDDLITEGVPAPGLVLSRREGFDQRRARVELLDGPPPCGLGGHRTTAPWTPPSRTGHARSACPVIRPGPAAGTSAACGPTAASRSSAPRRTPPRQPVRARSAATRAPADRRASPLRAPGPA